MPDRARVHRRALGLLGALLVVALGIGGCTVPSSDETDGVGTAGAASAGVEPTARLLLDDSFDGTTLDRSRWNTCHWWDPERCTIASNNELEWYEPGQARVEGGRLLLVAEPSQAADRDTHPYVSGMVTTGPQAEHGPSKVAFVYGRVEVELELPTGAGLWPAVWMLPASTSSRPEIDILETKGRDPERWTFHLHPKDRSKKSRGSSIRRGSLDEGRHTIGLDWQPGRLEWFVDGERVWQVTGQDVPDEPMYLVINLAVGGNFPGPVKPSTRFPAIVAVDRVRIWQ